MPRNWEKTLSAEERVKLALLQAEKDRALLQASKTQSAIRQIKQMAYTRASRNGQQSEKG